MLVVVQPQEAVDPFFLCQAEQIHHQAEIFQVKAKAAQMHRRHHQMHKIPFLRVCGKQALFVLPVESSSGNGRKYGNPRIGKVHAADKPAQIPKILPAKADIHNKQAHRMNGQFTEKADAGAVDIEGGSLGIAVKLPVADGLQADHHIFKADAGQSLHKLLIFRDKIGPAITDKGFMNVMAADKGDKLPKPIRIVKKIVVHDLNVGACYPPDLFYDKGKVPLTVRSFVQGPSVAEGTVMRAGGTGF